MSYTPPSGRTDHLTRVTQPSTTTKTQKPARVQSPSSNVGVHVIPKTQTQPTRQPVPNTKVVTPLQHGVRQKPGTELKYNT